MADQARISNLDAIEAFRVALIVFINKTRQTLDNVQDAVKKTRGWVQTEQPAYWNSQIRLRQKKLDQAQQELMSARLSDYVENPAFQQMAVRKALAALEEAQDGAKRTKAWGRDFDRTIDPLARKTDSLRDFIDGDLTKAVAYLVEIQKILQAYNEAPAAPPSSPS
ncbi:MAG: hypothetical protein B7Z37_19240 [Verrucomicrobia bacterium 12-59-8]|nr:MAG: hypothetical protein B7Z37_19240 [Verrucomicrobia bacterium 12-59-8]